LVTSRQPAIPPSDLKPGIVQCFGKAREHLESGLTLVNAGRVESAANLYVLAVQELGKAKLLRDAFDGGDSTPRIAAFSDHDANVEKGATVLGSSAMWLRRGAFQPGAFDPRVFDVGTPADEPTRLEVLYVNYGSTGWLKAPPVDAGELRGNIETALTDLTAKEAALLA
jgi:AbiV family abortive infection protein